MVWSPGVQQPWNHRHHHLPRLRWRGWTAPPPSGQPHAGPSAHWAGPRARFGWTARRAPLARFGRTRRRAHDQRHHHPPPQRLRPGPRRRAASGSGQPATAPHPRCQRPDTAALLDLAAARRTLLDHRAQFATTDAANLKAVADAEAAARAAASATRPSPTGISPTPKVAHAPGATTRSRASSERARVGGRVPAAAPQPAVDDAAPRPQQ